MHAPRGHEAGDAWEPVPPSMNSWAAEADARLLLEEIPPTCDALGPHNKLIFAPGLLGGAGVTTAGRLSIGAKSPLTGGVKEANAGGTAGDALGRLGIKAVVVEGQPEDHGHLHPARDRRLGRAPAGRRPARAGHVCHHRPAPGAVRRRTARSFPSVRRGSTC